ncbi:MAG: AMP-binding protein [Bdellovibrionaceae bacterium]|nr:AMP-binding protein [Pseudobdellovibrionaceae bacterium]
MNWFSEDNEILLNPRWPSSDRELLRAAARDVLDEQSLRGHLVLSSSGTTAESWRSVKLIFLSKKAVLTAAESVVKRFAFNSRDVFARSLPDFHVSGLGTSARAFIAGGRLADEKDPGVTVLSMVPTQLHDAVTEKRRPPGSLRRVFIGGGILAPELEREARQRGWPLVVTYGMTETAAMIAVREEADASLGFEILPHLQADVSADNHLRLRGGSLATGLAALSESGEARWRPLLDETAWFRTEDLASLRNGRLLIAGRGRDFVKIGGESVNVNRLREIFSQVLRNHQLPSIGFHLWARPSARLGHEIILVSEGSAAADLAEDYNRRVLPFERIREMIAVTAIPRTELGKVREEELKKMTTRLTKE